MKLKYNNIKISNQIKTMKIVIGLLAILSSFLICGLALAFSSAWFSDEKDFKSNLAMGTVDLDLLFENGETVAKYPLPVALSVGQNVFSENISLKKSKIGQSMYVRIKLEFSGSTGSIFNGQVTTESDANYKWIQKGPYFYLVDNNEKPLIVNNANTYKFLNKDSVKILEKTTNETVLFSAKGLQSDYNKIDNVETLIEKMGDETDLQNIKTITYNNSNATIQNGVKWARNGGSIKFKPVANKDYVIANVEANFGTLSGASADGFYTLSNITQNTTITITTKEDKFIVDKQFFISTGGKIRSNVDSGKGGGSVIFTLEPEDGYEVESFKINEVEKKEDLINNQYTQHNCFGTITAVVKYKLKTYSITETSVDANAGVFYKKNNGNEIDNLTTITHGDSLVIIPRVNQGQIDKLVLDVDNSSVKMGGQTISPINNQFVIEKVTDSISITIVLKQKVLKYNVTYINGGNANIFQGEKTAIQGVDYVFSIKATDDSNRGYYLKNLRETIYCGKDLLVKNIDYVILEEVDEKYETNLSKKIKIYGSSIKGDIKITGSADTSVCCFVAGTQIAMADGTYKNIEEIKFRDLVLSYDFYSKTLKADYVVNFAKVQRYETILITFRDKTVLEVTPDHPLYSLRGWVSYSPYHTIHGDAYPLVDINLEQFKKGDYLYSIQKRYNKEIVKVEVKKHKKPITVYTFGTSAYRNYFANDCLAHAGKTTIKNNNIFGFNSNYAAGDSKVPTIPTPPVKPDDNVCGR